MVDPVSTKRWLYWALLVVTALFILFIKILPLDLAAGGWPGPDWLIAVSFAWVLRRPDYVPVILFALIILFSDLVFYRPPRLWTAVSVLGLEFLRSRAQFSRDLPFLVEWVMVGGVFAAMAATNRIILTIFVIDQPTFGMDLLHLAATVLIYPVIVIISSRVLGVKKVAQGEVDQLGHRI